MTQAGKLHYRAKVRTMGGRDGGVAHDVTTTVAVRAPPR